MVRIEPKPREELTADQQQLHDMFESMASKVYGDTFTWQNKGAQVGPMPFYLHHAKTGMATFNLVGAMAEIPLASDAKETAIVTVASHHQAGYVTYAHSTITARAGYLSQSQIDQIKNGEKPQGLKEGCSVAYDVAKRLCSTPGPMPQSLWDKGVGVLGKDGVVGLLHYIGFYSYVSMFMNGADIQVPSDA